MEIVRLDIFDPIFGKAINPVRIHVQRQNCPGNGWGTARPFLTGGPLLRLGAGYLEFENRVGPGPPCLSQRQFFRRDEDDDPEGISHGEPAIKAVGCGAADEQPRREAEDWSEESDPIQPVAPKTGCRNDIRAVALASRQRLARTIAVRWILGASAGEDSYRNEE